jgi:ankyrin repeat protein
VLALLAAGPDIDSRDALGRTPLYLAAEEGHLNVLRTLLNAGASASLPERSGQTPSFRAAARGNQAVLRLLGKGNGKTIYRSHRRRSNSTQ